MPKYLLLLLSNVLIYVFIATACAFMVGATRTAAASSAHRIAPSAACHPSVASAHSAFATLYAFMVGTTRTAAASSAHRIAPSAACP
jgi:hypothetical protein